MNTRTVTAFGMILLAAPLMNGHAFADASYQSTTEITGGTLMDTMKSVPFFSKSMKNAFAPTTTLTMVHGNQKAVVNKDSTDIIDLDKEEMIHIDSVKRTYSVVTFAQMRQAMQNMPQQIQTAQAQVKQAQAQQPKTNLKMNFDVKVNNTGVSKVVNGLMAQEQVITLTTTITDPDAAAAAASGTTPAPGAAPDSSGTAPAPGTTPAPGQPVSISYTVTTDAWIAPDPPEVKEIQDFDVKMGKKMMEGVDMQAFVAQMKASGNAMSQMLGGQPGASDAMAQMGKEMAKLKGTRVLEVTSMGGMAPMQGTGTAPAAAPAATPAPSGGSVAGQVAGDTATQTAANESGRLGGFGSALGGSMMSAWHKKKASTPPPAPAPAAAPTSATPAAGQTQSAVLMSMTMQKSNFSQEPVGSSAFEIPAGYTQVASPYERMSQNQ